MYSVNIKECYRVASSLWISHPEEETLRVFFDFFNALWENDKHNLSAWVSQDTFNMICREADNYYNPFAYDSERIFERHRITF